MDAPNRMTPKASWTWCVSQFGVVSIEEKTIGNLQRPKVSEMSESYAFCTRNYNISMERPGISRTEHK